MGKDRIRLLNKMIENNLRLSLGLVSKGRTTEAKDYIDSSRELIWELIKNEEVTRVIPKEELDKLLKKVV